MIKGLAHIGVTVRDLDRAIEFYRDVMGMELVARGSVDRDEQYDEIFELRQVTAQSALLQAGALKVELFDFSDPSSEPPEGERPVNVPGISHFCIEVADIDAEYERLRRSGVRFHCPPLRFRTVRCTYGRDSEGNVFELSEQTEAS
jgi:glyoxylase I family protein